MRELDFDIEEEALRVLGGWLTGEWFWYQSNMFPNMMQQIFDKEEAKEILQQRLDSISSEASQ